MAACALMQLSTVIMMVIPRCVKLATVVGMGLLIALIGMVSIRLVVPNTDVRCCMAWPPHDGQDKLDLSHPSTSIHLPHPMNRRRQTLVTLGDFRDYHIWLALVGLVVTGSLLFHQVGR